MGQYTKTNILDDQNINPIYTSRSLVALIMYCLGAPVARFDGKDYIFTGPDKFKNETINLSTLLVLAEREAPNSIEYKRLLALHILQGTLEGEGWPVVDPIYLGC